MIDCRMCIRFAEDGGTVWPDLNSFREMLRRESSVRIELAGPSIIGAIRLENRFRMMAYKWWLNALEEGIGSPEPFPVQPLPH